MNSYLRIGAALLAVSSLSACATVTRGTKQKYSIKSQPDGAHVALTTGETCVTPCKLKLKRKHDFTARFTKEGYEPFEAKVESKFSGGGGVAAAGNVLIGGVIGAVVDGTNGSLNSLFPDSLDVAMTPVKAPAPVAAPVEAAGSVAAQAPAVQAAPASEVAPAANQAPTAEEPMPTSEEAPAGAPQLL